MTIHHISQTIHTAQKPPRHPAKNTADTAFQNMLVSANLKQSSTSSPQPPLETYAVPSWRSDYGYHLNAKPGTTATALGTKNEPGAPGAELAKVPAIARKEYLAVVNALYRDVLRDNRIDSPETHYQSLIVDRAKSEAIHQQFLNKLHSHPAIARILGST